MITAIEKMAALSAVRDDKVPHNDNPATWTARLFEVTRGVDTDDGTKLDPFRVARVGDYLCSVSSSHTP